MIEKEVTLTYAQCCARVWSCDVGETRVPGENPLVRHGDYKQMHPGRVSCLGCLGKMRVR